MLLSRSHILSIITKIFSENQVEILSKQYSKLNSMVRLSTRYKDNFMYFYIVLLNRGRKELIIELYQKLGVYYNITDFTSNDFLEKYGLSKKYDESDEEYKKRILKKYRKGVD